MNILVLTNEYPSVSYPKKNSPWTVPYFVKEWTAEGHNVLVIVNSSKFLRLFYFGAKLLKKFLEKKYNMISDDVGKLTWARPFRFLDHGATVCNLPIFKFWPSTNFSKRTLKKQSQKIIAVCDELEFKPDLITGHWVNPQLPLINALKAFFGCKTSFVFEGDFRPSFLSKYRASRFIGNIDRIGCRSKFAQKCLKESLNLDYPPFICYSGVPDSMVFSAPPKKAFDAGHLKIFSAGRLVGLKRFDSLISACDNAFGKSGCFELLIAGEGGKKQDLCRQIRILNNENIHLVGQLPRNALFDYYDRADVFALVSENEAFGIVYLEAMARGCIVIGSCDGGADGIIIDGYNGFLCEAGNSDQLANVLKRIYALSPKQKEEISQRAIETASSFTESAVAKLYLTEAYFYAKPGNL